METLTPRDEFIILACDGLWAAMTSQQAVNYVRKMLIAHRDPQVVAKLLVDKALKLATNDNVTAVVVCFGLVAPP